MCGNLKQRKQKTKKRIKYLYLSLLPESKSRYENAEATEASYFSPNYTILARLVLVLSSELLSSTETMISSWLFSIQLNQLTKNDN